MYVVRSLISEIDFIYIELRHLSVIFALRTADFSPEIWF